MPARPKRINEVKKEELNPYANDVKLAMLQTHQMTIPIERVIYVNDANSVTHKPGSNRYYINFPETWRTTNQKHIIGVRSIHLKHGRGRTFGFKLHFEYYTPPEDPLITIDYITYEAFYPFEFEYSYGESNDNPDPNEWLKILNKTWEIYTENHGENWDKYEWQCTYDEQSSRYILELVPVDSTTESESGYKEIMQSPLHYRLESVSPDLYNCDVIFDKNVYQSIISTSVKTLPLCEMPKIIIPGPLETYDEYLVAASFVEQTSHNYLGFTNTVFSPPKYYQLSSSDTNFWIDLVSPDGLKPRELPADGRDMLVIEIQLMTQPYIQKF